MLKELKGLSLVEQVEEVEAFLDYNHFGISNSNFFTILLLYYKNFNQKP